VRAEGLIDAVSALAKKLGLTAHFGITPKGSRLVAPERYEAALAAAEKALSNGERAVHAERSPSAARSTLALLRRPVREAVVDNPELLAARFQHYVSAVTLRYAYRLEPVRAQLEAVFDQIADALESTGALDEKGLAELRSETEKAAAETDTLNDLAEVYRRAVLDVEQSLLRPKQAGHARSIRRALTYMRDHYGEEVSRAKVARIAGFAEHTFSRSFVKSEGLTFQKYLKRLRIERAKQMLLSTKLSIERVGKLCGFGTRVQFHKAFKQALGKTPQDFREARG
jgi:AraC-like DNA-binding protein